MSVAHDEVKSPNHQHAGFPWTHVIGYVLSIVLTVIGFWVVLAHNMGAGATITTIMVLAVLQIFVQLWFFMHIRESHGPAYHVATLSVGFLFVFVIIAGSIWIMSFGYQVS